MRDARTRQRPAGTGRRVETMMNLARKLYGNGERASRLPPYGCEVMDALAAGRIPNTRLYACRPDPWPLARVHRRMFGPATVLVFPVDADPESFRWPPLRNLIVNVTGLPGGALPAIARALVRDGLLLAYMLDADHPERNLRVVAKRCAE